jgi:ribosome-associated toxin RatA of RatAB toxin-antitoxin module
LRSELAIDIAAPPSRIFELAADIARWPTLLPHYRNVTIQSRTDGRALAQMVAVRRFGPLAVPVAWRAEQWADDSDPADLRLRFRHVRGVTRGMDVTWHIRPANGDPAAGTTASRVTIEHVFSRPLPLVGPDALPRLIDRFFVKPIASRTLATFKRLAEQAE